MVVGSSPTGRTRCEIDTTDFDERDKDDELIVDPELSNVCKDFIRNDLTYGGCVAFHENDSNFYDDEWRVYLGGTKQLWRKGTDDDALEIIRLLDQNGLTVDLWRY